MSKANAEIVHFQRMKLRIGLNEINPIYGKLKINTKPSAADGKLSFSRILACRMGGVRRK